MWLIHAEAMRAAKAKLIMSITILSKQKTVRCWAADCAGEGNQADRM